MTKRRAKWKWRGWRPGSGLVKIWNIDMRYLSLEIDYEATRAECKRLRDELEWLGLNTVAACTHMPVYKKDPK